MNLLEILAVCVVLFLTILFWVMVSKDDSDDIGCLFFFLCAAWLGIVFYFIDFFTQPLW